MVLLHVQSAQVSCCHSQEHYEQLYCYVTVTMHRKQQNSVGDENARNLQLPITNNKYNNVKNRLTATITQ